MSQQHPFRIFVVTFYYRGIDYKLILSSVSWHTSFIAQPEHPQEQEEPPFFRFFISFDIINTKSNITNIKTIAVEIFIFFTPYMVCKRLLIMN